MLVECHQMKCLCHRLTLPTEIALFRPKTVRFIVLSTPTLPAISVAFMWSMEWFMYLGRSSGGRHETVLNDAPNVTKAGDDGDKLEP
mmetsp:Transcript_6013/g.11302  ORF Transcript_6013/g.11302 Transcript_6013/m.11302 type:complete len:87 (+) Transcript_6013:94-354(+)